MVVIICFYFYFYFSLFFLIWNFNISSWKWVWEEEDNEDEEEELRPSIPIQNDARKDRNKIWILNEQFDDEWHAYKMCMSIHTTVLQTCTVHT